MSCFVVAPCAKAQRSGQEEPHIIFQCVVSLLPGARRARTEAKKKKAKEARTGAARRKGKRNQRAVSSGEWVVVVVVKRSRGEALRAAHSRNQVCGLGGQVGGGEAEWGVLPATPPAPTPAQGPPSRGEGEPGAVA